MRARAFAVAYGPDAISAVHDSDGTIELLYRGSDGARHRAGHAAP